MKNFALDFFSRNVQLSQKEELFIAKYKSRPLNDKNHKERNYKYEALGILTYLQMILFGDEETGFYYDVSDNRFILLANKLDITPKQLSQILNWCFEFSILDKAMYQKYKILTSYKMQDDYSKVLDKPQDRVRAQNINMDYVYQDCDFTQKFKNALQKFKNAVQKRDNALQKKGEETRPEDIIQDNIREDDSTTTFSLTKYKNQFFEKYPTKTKKFKNTDEVLLNKIGNININCNELFKIIDNSDFLKTRNNLGAEWFLLNYNKVITNDYSDYKKNEPTKQTQNYSNRDYSNIDLNSIFGDLSKVEL